jgi:hypothetical protein
MTSKIVYESIRVAITVIFVSLLVVWCLVTYFSRRNAKRREEASLKKQEQLQKLLEQLRKENE